MNEQNRDQQNNQGSEENKETKIFFTWNSTLQTPEEGRRDKSNDPENNDQISITDTNWKDHSDEGAETKTGMNRNEQNQENSPGQ